MNPQSRNVIKKTASYIAFVLAAVGALYLMKILNRTIYLELHPAVYGATIIAAAIFLTLRFRRHKATMTASTYASEILAGIGFIILACFLIIPESIAALNYYLPSRTQPYTVECFIVEKHTNYTRGASTRYVTFRPENGREDFKLKVSSSYYRRARPGSHIPLTLRQGALGYPILIP